MKTMGKRRFIAIALLAIVPILLPIALPVNTNLFVTSVSSLSLSTLSSANAATSKSKLANISDVDALTFKSTAITVGGKKRNLASKELITISFKDKGISIKADCNSMFGAATLAKGILTVKALASTKMACSPALMKQDTWLSKIITTKPRITVQGKTITITSSGSAANRSVIKMTVYETYGYADTPLGDENSEALVKETCTKLIADKATESQAQFAAEQNALIFRVTSREGEDFAVTMDYRVNRMNVKILGGIVVECTQG